MSRASSLPATLQQVNSGLVLLYWRVGPRIRQDILKEKRAESGEGISPAVNTGLTTDFGLQWDGSIRGIGLAALTKVSALLYLRKLGVT